MPAHARPVRRVIAGTAGLAAAVTAIAAPAWAQDEVVLSVGHADAVEVNYEDGELTLNVKDDTSPPPVFRDPADVIFQVLPESANVVPDDPRFAFLGEPGDTVWLLPQTQDPNLLWPGWSTERLRAGVFEGNAVTLTLASVAGPGTVTVYNIDAFSNPTVRWRAEDGMVDPDSLVVPINTHAHAVWAFDAEGTYTLTFRADATLTSGEEITTGPVDFTFVVGELPGNGHGDVDLTIAGMAGSYKPGDDVTLTAVQEPETGEDNYRWYEVCPGGGGFSVIPDEGEDVYSFTAESDLDGCQYLVRLFDDENEVIAESDPVTLNVTDPGGDPEVSQTVIATIDEDGGALIISVDPEDRTVVMSPAELNAAGDRLVSTGELRPVTVTDTRPDAPGWNASGQVGDFTGDAGTFEGRYLGWTPAVLDQASGQQVSAGDPVPAGLDGGDGLSIGRTLGIAPSGAGLGTAELGADLTLELPTETPAGEYVATLTFTTI
jgi:surface-anchored protein